MGDVDEIGESERSGIPHRRLSRATYPLELPRLLDSSLCT